MSTSTAFEAPSSAPEPARELRPPVRRGPVAWLLLGVGAVTATAMIGAGASGIVSVGSRQEASGSARLGGVREVVVEGGSCAGDVVVRGVGSASSTGGVALTWRDSWGLSRPRHTQTVDDSGVLRVSVTCPRASFGWSPSSDLTLTVPAGAPVQVVTGAGDVTTTDLAHAQRLRTGSGGIAVTGTGSGPLRLRTGSGDVRARGEATDVTASSGSGDVLVAMTKAPLDVAASTGSGDVVLEVPVGRVADTYDVETRTGSGEVHVGVDDVSGASRHLSLRSGSGDLTMRPVR